jgi:hypothetical protein
VGTLPFHRVRVDHATHISIELRHRRPLNAADLLDAGRKPVQNSQLPHRRSVGEIAGALARLLESKAEGLSGVKAGEKLAGLISGMWRRVK